MKKPKLIDHEDRACWSVWDCLDTEEKQAARIVLKKRFPRFKPPPAKLPPLESTEEIEQIMAESTDIKK